MGKLPVLKPREVAARLESLGFAEIRQRGSHKQYRHPDGRGTTIPFHAGRDISLEQLSSPRSQVHAVPACAAMMRSRVWEARMARLTPCYFSVLVATTTGFSTQVSVVRAGERLADDGGNAFVADADHGRAPSAAWGGPPANVSWRDARTLVVRYHPSARVFVSPRFVEVSTGWFAGTRVDLVFETAQ